MSTNEKKERKTHHLVIIRSLICYTIVRSFFLFFLSCTCGKRKYGTYELISDDSVCGQDVVHPAPPFNPRKGPSRERDSRSRLLYPCLFLRSWMDRQVKVKEKNKIYHNINNKEKSQGIVAPLCHPEIHQKFLLAVKKLSSDIRTESNTQKNKSAAVFSSCETVLNLNSTTFLIVSRSRQAKTTRLVYARNKSEACFTSGGKNTQNILRI